MFEGETIDEMKTRYVSMMQAERDPTKQKEIFSKMMKAEHALKFTSPRFVPEDLHDNKSMNKSLLSGGSVMTRRSRLDIM